MNPYLSVSDLLIPPLFIIVILFHTAYIKKKYIYQNDAYRFYLTGMIVKIIGAVAICLVYTLYYPAGDTTSYFEQGRTIYNLFFKNTDYFCEIMFCGPTNENYSYMDEQTTYIAKYIW